MNAPLSETVARWKDSRKIVKRIVVSGTLVLLTPARFGGGEGRTSELAITDMPLLRHPLGGKPLLTGTSIAGAARSYLREWENNYEILSPADGNSKTQALFGEVLENVPDPEKESRASWLIVDDACSEDLGTEARPGVAIDPKKRTAKVDEKTGRGFLYDMELLEAGAQFPLRFELALPEDAAMRSILLQVLAVTLTGFERGEIGLGARKRRGLGECKVDVWKVEEYNLKTRAGLLAWLEAGSGVVKTGDTVAAKLGVDLEKDVPDLRRRFTLDATFHLETSLLIRSGSDLPAAPDMVHLKSKRGKEMRPILSGTSLAGALRARALRIANTMQPGEAENLVAGLFGPKEIKRGGSRSDKWASRAVVREREVADEYERVQSRVKIDRFTGGSFPGALFEQQPVFGGRQTNIHVSIELRDPQEQHIGLLLHLLKDLWTGDLPLGGEASVGRGRLRGVEATLVFQSPDQTEKDQWKILALPDNKLQVDGDSAALERYAKSVGGAK